MPAGDTRLAAPSVVVVGSGIVGAFIAYFLNRSGARVTLLEALTPAAGASGASDGAVSVASKRPGPMMHLARLARAMYVEMQQQGVLQNIYHTRPTYLFARTEEEVGVISDQGAELQDEGERILFLTHAELLQRVPGLGQHVRADMKAPDDGHALGYQVVDRLLQAGGIQPRRFQPIRRLVISGDRVVGVDTPNHICPVDFNATWL